MYERLCDRASRLLSSLTTTNTGTAAEKPVQTDGPAPHERILDMSRLLRQDTVSDQHESLFFTRLPAEVRQHIYSYVLPPDRRIWVRPTPDRAPKSAVGGSLWVEHFPCPKAPTDLTWVDAREPSACCAPIRTGFFGCVRARELQPHADTLALLKTCQRMYLDLCELCTFCFDDVGTLRDFSALYAAIPIRHVQMVFYYRPPSRYVTFNPEHQRRQAAQRESWQRVLRDVDAACKRMGGGGLNTVLLSIHPDPTYLRLGAKDTAEAVAWMGSITAGHAACVEVMGYHTCRIPPREMER